MNHGKKRLRRLLFGSSLTTALAFSFIGSPTQAQQAPEPSPTEAGIKVESQIQVVGAGSGSAAQESAILNGYRQLLERGAAISGVVNKENASGYQFFRINQDHPHFALLDWALRSTVETSQDASKKQTTVKMTSPPVAELNEEIPQSLKTLAVDIDGDKKNETLAATYDGRIILQKASPRGVDLLAQSACLNSYTHVTYRIPGSKEASWDQIRLTQLKDIRSVEVLGSDRLRVVAELLSLETVGGVLVGRATEEREVFIRVWEPGSEPTLELNQPSDFTYTSNSTINLRGAFRAPSGLTSARVRYNGRPFWQTPEGLNSKNLKMNVVVPLLPGWNSAQVLANDSSRRLISREVLIHREAPPSGLMPGKRRALLVGVGSYASSNFERLPTAESDVENVKRFIMGPQNGAGFALQNVQSLKAEQATRQAILDKLHSLRSDSGSPAEAERLFTLIYFSGWSTRTGGGSQGLLPYDTRGLDDGALSADDLIEALGPLGNQDVLLILDCPATKFAAGRQSNGWLSNQDFVDRLEKEGWAVISAGQSRNGAGIGSFNKGLMQALAGSADSDNDGLVEFDELYRGLFQEWQKIDNHTDIDPPIRRGNLLGRTPVLAIRR